MSITIQDLKPLPVTLDRPAVGMATPTDGTASTPWRAIVKLHPGMSLPDYVTPRAHLAAGFHTVDVLPDRWARLRQDPAVEFVARAGRMSLSSNDLVSAQI